MGGVDCKYFNDYHFVKRKVVNIEIDSAPFKKCRL